jgi:hypothetical protein
VALVRVSIFSSDGICKRFWLTGRKDHKVRIIDFRDKFFSIFFLMNYSCYITEKSQ